MIKFGIKIGVVTGTIYYLSGQGVWKDSEKSLQLYNDLKANLSPYTQEISKQIPFEFPHLPQTNEISYLSKYYWNRGVCASFNFISHVPSYFRDLSNQGMNAIMNNTEIKNLFIETVDTVSKEDDKIKK